MDHLYSRGQQTSRECRVKPRIADHGIFHHSQHVRVDKRHGLRTETTTIGSHFVCLVSADIQQASTGSEGPRRRNMRVGRIAEWAYSSGMASPGFWPSFNRFRTSAQSAAFDSDSSVASIETFAFKTRETGHPRLASRAAFSNVVRSTPGTRALTAR